MRKVVVAKASIKIQKNGVAMAFNDLGDSETIFHRMAATVYPDSCTHEKYKPFEASKCYYTACMGILKHKEASNRILILGNSGVPQHAILVDRNNRILEDSYRSKLISWKYPTYINQATDAHGKPYESRKTVIADIPATHLSDYCKDQE